MVCVVFVFPPEARGEAGPADQEAREAGPGRRQPGPERRQGVAEDPHDERNNRTSSTLSPSAVSPSITPTGPSI